MTRFAALLLLAVPAVALAAPVPKEGKDESKLYLTVGGKIVKLSPDGTSREVVCDKGDGHDDSLSPDGKWIVSMKRDNSKDRHFVMLREPGGKAKEAVQVSHMASVRWSADGKTLYGVDEHLRPDNKGGGLVEAGRRCWRYELETGKQTMLDIPEKYTLIGETPDGKRLVYQHITGEQMVSKKPHLVYTQKQETVVSPRDKFEPEVLISEAVNVSSGVPFPDGKRRFVSAITPYEHDIGVYTHGEKKPAWFGLKAHYAGWAVSPNGRRVAYATDEIFPKEGQRRADKIELYVADADGKNAKKIFGTEKDVTHIDWR